MENINWEGLVRDLASSLNVTADKLFEILAQGMVAEGIVNLVWAGFAVITMILGAVGFRRFWKLSTKAAEDNNKSEEDEADVLTVLCAFAIILGFLVLAFNMGDGIIKTTSPEYSATKYIIQQVK